MVGAVIGACMIALVIWKRRDTKRLETSQKFRSKEISRRCSIGNVDVKLLQEKEASQSARMSQRSSFQSVIKK